MAPPPEAASFDAGRCSAARVIWTTLGILARKLSFTPLTSVLPACCRRNRDRREQDVLLSRHRCMRLKPAWMWASNLLAWWRPRLRRCVTLPRQLIPDAQGTASGTGPWIAVASKFFAAVKPPDLCIGQGAQSG